MVRVRWTEATPPTAAEMRALQRAARAGTLRAGARVGRASGDLAATAAAQRSFRWGRRAGRAGAVSLDYSGGLYVLGEVRRVEYAARKGRGAAAIWVHDFERPFPRLTATADGRLGPIIGGKARVTRRGIEG